MLVIGKQRTVNLQAALKVTLSAEGEVWAWYGGEDEAVLYRGPDAAKVYRAIVEAWAVGRPAMYLEEVLDHARQD